MHHAHSCSLTHLHLLNRILSVSNLRCGNGWVVGIRPEATLIGRGPPMARLELENNWRETFYCKIVYILRKIFFKNIGNLIYHCITTIFYNTLLEIINHEVV